MFESLGLGREEEQLYLRLLSLGGTPLPALARGVEGGVTRARSLLASLESKGFVVRSPTPKPLYIPVSPDAAVELLALRRQEDIERARATAEQLARDYRARLSRTEPTQLVEMVAGREAISQQFRQLQMATRSELVAFDMPPYVEATAENPIELERLSRHVRYRIVYDRSALENPSVVENIERFIDAGEEARTFGGLPMKLDIMDNKVALLPVNLEEPGEPAALVVHAPSVVVALKMLFEAVWERSSPLAVGQQPGVEEVDLLDEHDRRLLLLLAGGLKDETVARQLGQDPRTVRRRLRRIMDRLGVTTRFQAGMQVVRREWL